MRMIVLLVLLTFLTIESYAQNIGDAIRYSTYNLNGTARSVGAGGALGALGADFSVLSTNPAGLAQFRRSEFVATPALLFNRTDAQMQEIGSTQKETMTRFNFGSIGVVFANRPNSLKWKTFNVGLGFNRLANFNRRFASSGFTTGSITDQWVIDANNGFFDNFANNLAIEAGAIYPDNNNTAFFTDFDLNPGAAFDHRQSFRSTGSLNEMVFAIAGNLNERFLIGATLGIPFVSYNEERVYEEEEVNQDEIPAFEALRYEENLSTSGLGINFKLGMIFRLSQAIRLGAAIHTPSKLVLTDNFDTGLEYTYLENGGIFTGDVNSQEATFDYDFRTPWRFMANAGFLINRSGFISAEIEWVNYSNGEFNLDKDGATQADRDYQVVLNNSINDNLGSAVNFRLGGEYAYKMLRFRAGYNIFGAAFDGDDANQTSFSLGIGSRFRNFYIDLAYKRSQIEESFAPYSLNGNFPIVVDTEERSDRYLLTFGFKF
ncbi:MAG: hypothetical protein AAF990_18000 [Bacteroidota bacterium]